MNLRTNKWMNAVSALAWGVLTVGFVASCSNSPDDEILTGDNTPVEARFSAQIAAPATTRTATRASGTTWDNGDKVGIFMLIKDGNLATGLSPEGHILANNHPYVIDLSTLEGDDKTIADAVDYLEYVPEDDGGEGAIYMLPGTAYDFVAYYPYTATNNLVDGYKLPISLADQHDAYTAADHDVLYATSTRKNVLNNSVAFEFGHVLSNITINVTRERGVDATAFAEKNAVLTGMPTIATFDLSGTEDDAFADFDEDDTYTITAAPSDAAGELYEIIVLPQAAGAYANRTIAFEVSGKGYYWSIPNGFAYESGKRYTYNFTLTADGSLTINGDVLISDWNDAVDLTDDSWETDGTDTFSFEIKTVEIIAAGETATFMMGSELANSEKPIHEVTLTIPFKMGTTPITVEQYCYFLNANLDKFTSTAINVTATLTGTDAFGVEYTYSNVLLAYANALTIQYNGSRWYVMPGRAKYPMGYVTWYGAFAFAEWAGGRLPTEAEWEYASKAGSTDVTATGNYGLGVTSLSDPTPIQITTTNLGAYAWYLGNNTNGGYPAGLKPVGLKLPNAFGLYDMHGNTFEWCYDYYVAYTADPITDPKGTSGSRRVSRGGSYGYGVAEVRSALRGQDNPVASADRVGFRIIFPNE